MSGAVLALMGAAISGGSGGGGGGGSTLAAVATPDPLEWYFNESTYTATAFAEVSGGLEPYTVEWVVPGSLNILFVSNDTVTVESFTGVDADISFGVTDANAEEAASNTLTITLPA